MKIKQDNEEIEENLRLLYVALTRPQEHLILVDVVKEYQPASLDYQLLRNHKRKVDLLLAASPHNTILRVIDGMELTENSLNPISEDEGATVFTEKLTLSFDQEESITPKNRDLNFDKSFGVCYRIWVYSCTKPLKNFRHRIWTDADLKDFLSQAYIQQKSL
ncbi:hypothetical protein [Erysipelothrix piscisicarius]|uniref:hypothetical protein n=1 Tax=Erysipelothrix piscisicarius TaxID=2485784 RepID=UPI002F9221D4